MSDLVGNPEDRFSRVEAQLQLQIDAAHTKHMKYVTEIS